MKRTKKWIAMGLALAMLFSLAACGGKDSKGGKKAKTPEEVGSYTLYELDLEGDLLDHETIVMAGMEESWILELKADGTGSMATDEDGEMDATDIKWGDGKITIVEEGTTVPYTFQDGKLSFEVDGVKLTFQKGGPSGTGSLPGREKENLAGNQGREKKLTDDQAYWDGDWYGFYYYENAQNDCETLLDVESDVMARVTVEEDGTGTLVLWDDVSSQEEPVARVNFEVDEGGRLVSDTGAYLGAEIGRADWLVDQDNLGYENLVRIDGTFTVPDDFFSHADYSIYLRPWGLDWADIEEEQPQGLPYYYEWYMDQIGDNEEMPHAFPDGIWNYDGSGDGNGDGSGGTNWSEGLTPVGREDGAVFGVELPQGYSYNDGWSCYSSADYTVAIWLPDANVFETRSEMDSAMSGKNIAKTVNLGGCEVYLCEEENDIYGAVTFYFVDVSGFTDYAGCKIMVSSNEGDLAATQSQEILDMIASLWVL